MTQASSDLLLQRADALQERAGMVVEALGLVGRWGRAGRVAAVGSSQFGLMASHNLDFEVYTDSPDIHSGFKVVGGIAQVPGVREILYLNVLNTPDPGLYWRIDYEDADGTVWDIDQWLVPNDHPHAGVAERLAASMRGALTETTRRAVLEIKSARQGLPKCRGIDIYKAVLRDHVRSVGAFARWIEANPPALDSIETWHP